MHLHNSHLTFFLTAALLFGGAQIGFTAEEPQQREAAATTEHEPEEAENPAAMADNASGKVLEPAPLSLDYSNIHSRNPFDEPVNAMVFDDYGTVLERISLRGVVGIDGKVIGLFAIMQAGAQHEEAAVLQRYELGEIIPVFQGRKEYLFTLQNLEQRFAVLQGGDGKTYRVWL
jgi:hypothetical protein